MKDKERATAIKSKVGDMSPSDLQTLLKVHRVRVHCRSTECTLHFVGAWLNCKHSSFAHCCFHQYLCSPFVGMCCVPRLPAFNASAPLQPTVQQDVLRKVKGCCTYCPPNSSTIVSKQWPEDLCSGALALCRVILVHGRSSDATCDV